MNKKVCSFPILFALLALLIGTCAVVFPASAQAAPTSTGSITVSGTVASSYNAYQIFSTNVVDGDNDAKIATDLAWASDAARDAVLPVLHSAGMSNSQTTAQEAAEWLNTDSHLTSALSAQLARSLQSSGAEPVALNAGTTAELPCGYWLIVADDAIAQGEAGTAPIMALVGGSAVTVKPKAATPKVAKHVLEDSTAAWQKAADATVGDDLYWRLSATVPAGLTAYDTYTVRFVDTMSAGLDPSKVAASMRVYVAAGADGGFGAVSAGKDGRAGTEPAKGWKDITAQCVTKVAADGTFTVRTGDLIAALGGADAFAAGARVVAVYDAPLASGCNHGIAKGNPNEVYLRYPRSPFADQSGDAGFTRTPSDDATAYTWDLALTKRGSDGDKPLPGAVLSITDDRGRTLAADGTWDAEGKATVTTGEDGRVTVSGVDSGKLEVRELKAPKGYTAFEGTRSVTVKAEGLDVDQVAAAKPKLSITAESPLRADSADGSTGSLEASLINTPTGTPPSTITGGFMPSTGDMAMYAAAAAAVAGAALLVVALLVKRGGGNHAE